MNNELNILLEGCKQYNRLSQEKLYKQLYPEMFILCCKFFDDEHDILTALNNGMLNVFNNIEKYNINKGSLEGWAYSIVRNAAISLIRSKATKPTTEELSPHLKVETSVNPFKEENIENILDSLKTLTITTRAVFSLFYIEGYLIKEIAVDLEMKEGTVKWHLNEGRNKLKNIFNNTNKNELYAK